MWTILLETGRQHSDRLVRYAQSPANGPISSRTPKSGDLGAHQTPPRRDSKQSIYVKPSRHGDLGRFAQTYPGLRSMAEWSLTLEQCSTLAVDRRPALPFNGKARIAPGWPRPRTGNEISSDLTPSPPRPSPNRHRIARVVSSAPCDGGFHRGCDGGQLTTFHRRSTGADRPRLAREGVVTCMGCEQSTARPGPQPENQCGQCHRRPAFPQLRLRLRDSPTKGKRRAQTDDVPGRNSGWNQRLPGKRY